MIEMKDSGIEWIGVIPAHWEVKRLKDVSILFSGLTGKAGEDFSPEPEDGLKPYIPFTNVLNNREIDPNTVNYVRIDKGEEQNLVNKDDLIFLMSSEDYDSIAKSAVVTSNVGEVYLNSFCRGLHITKKSILPKFLNYLLLASSCRDELRFQARGFTRINIKIDKIASHFIFYPHIKEQQAIADYLDKKTAEIDEQITALEKKSDAYQRLKRSLISEVVTRGLNPTAELKDSGIEWIGEIPEHWVIKRFKEMFRHYSTGFTPDSKDMKYFADDEINTWVTIADLVDKYIVDSNMYLSNKAINDYAPILSPKGSLLFSFKLSVGKTAFAGKNLYTNEAIVTIPPQRNNDVRYFYYLIPEACANNATENIYGAKMLNQKIIANMILFAPPIDEQRAIADYLDKKTAEIDSNISAISSKIDAYKRLKQSLIDEVVTGKRRIEKA